jgi:hypothetical protein
MRGEFGYEIPPAPATLDGVAVFTRFLDGLAFRYYWATEGLRADDYEFRPGPSSMSTKELLQHVLSLALMIEQCAENRATRESFESEDPATLRLKTLEILQRVRERLAGLDDHVFAEHRVVRRDGSIWPVWNIMNGPLADALTHVGQINAWRRLNGNPVRRRRFSRAPRQCAGEKPGPRIASGGREHVEIEDLGEISRAQPVARAVAILPSPKSSTLVARSSWTSRLVSPYCR